MLIAAALIELALPEAETIKARRRVARSVKDRIRQRFNVSVAEVVADDVTVLRIDEVEEVEDDGDAAPAAWRADEAE
jgi:uncharacterized protein YlxP (DUF503 family)